LVGRHEKTVIRNTLRNPDPIRPVHVIAAHLHDPGFLRIGDGQRLARSVVAELLDELSHELDGLTGCLAPFQRHTGKLRRIEDAFLRFRFRVDLGLVGAFRDGELVLVHDAVIGVKVGIGVGYLGNESERNAGRFAGRVIARPPVLGHDPVCFACPPLGFEVQGTVGVENRPQCTGFVVHRRHINHASIAQAVVRM